MTCMLYRLDDLKNVKCELKALINEKIVLILMLMMVMVMTTMTTMTNIMGMKTIHMRLG